MYPLPPSSLLVALGSPWHFLACRFHSHLCFCHHRVLPFVSLSLSLLRRPCPWIWAHSLIQDDLISRSLTSLHPQRLLSKIKSNLKIPGGCSCAGGCSSTHYNYNHGEQAYILSCSPAMHPTRVFYMRYLGKSRSAGGLDIHFRAPLWGTRLLSFRGAVKCLQQAGIVQTAVSGWNFLSVLMNSAF